jgi:excinuclease UvrABC nuclease subunit
MKEKAKQLKFEEATKIKNQIKNIESLSQKQIARDAIPGNNDVLVYLEKYGKIFIALTEIIE